MTLRGSAHGSELTGPNFMSQWAAKTSNDLFRYNRANMPPGSSGSLSEADHLSVIARVVHNGVIYVTHPGNIIQVLDASTGDLIWA